MKKQIIAFIVCILPTLTLGNSFVGTGVADHSTNSVNTFFIGYEYTDLSIQYSFENIYISANQESIWDNVIAHNLSTKYHPTSYDFGKPFIRLGLRYYEDVDMKSSLIIENMDSYFSLGTDINFYDNIIITLEGGSMGKGFYSEDKTQVYGHGFFSEVSIRYHF